MSKLHAKDKLESFPSRPPDKSYMKKGRKKSNTDAIYEVFEKSIQYHRKTKNEVKLLADEIE